MKSPRKSVYDLLLRMEKGKAYSRLALGAELSRAGFGERDGAFVSALFYGVLERRITLDYIIGKFSRVALGEMDAEAAALLRMALYQILFMDCVPESAAVNESVRLAPHKIKPFVNAVARNFLRAGGDFPNGEDLSLSVKYSCPEWLVKKWFAEYGEEAAEKILRSSLNRPPLHVRSNVLKYPDLPVSARLPSFSAAGANADKFHVQDISSQKVCEMLAPKSGETVIDVCAAPGGKSFTLAQLMNNEGRLVACDIRAERLPLIREGAKRLGLSVIETLQNDGRRFNPDMPAADRVLCDVPCSGLGVIRRKPEIKYKPPDSFAGLPETQKSILATSSRYVKSGGILMYSTCALSKAENEEVVRDFLERSGNFKLAEERTFIPDETGGDGFFAAIMEKV
ncbi:MAG: methyltransferase domain-containing protein [Oscillospiraceae bacterium]|nr:methyltransferase domain-containing protein [Oscillospiraceae bacterium]